ncbi:MAG TPA: hypothetical protein DCG48_05505 [Rhodospirillaceae bacterium]|nr:hypothetical protein [Rhodospirillaceae bacterium]|tara:strand:+ start:287 stop:1102 length:816 start_codon:yes stop_codon:yes gene_type:complete
MILRLAFAAFAFFLLMPTPSAQAQFQSIRDHDWCFENMPATYDEVFDACVEDKCTRISNKKISQKRACYRRCSRDAVDACLAKRDAGGASQAARPAAAPVRPALKQPSAPQAPQPSARPASPAQPAPAPSVASRPADPAPAAPAEAQREGFMSRLFGGWGSGPETPSDPAAAAPAPADGTASAAPDGQGEGKRKGFFTRLMDGATTGVSEGFDPDYNWCRDHSGGFFQERLQDCTRGCLAGPSSAANKRRGCIQSCKSDAVDACIARRDGK